MTEIDDAIVKSRGWLLAQFDHDERGWGERPGSEVSLLNTAEVVINLRAAGVSPGEQPIKEAIECLEGAQESGGVESGCWNRRGSPDLIRTSVVLRALLAAGRPVSAASTRGAIGWLLGRGGTDGLWGFERGDEAAFMPSCFALFALCDAVHVGDQGSAQEVGLRLQAFLRTFRADDGSFPDHELTTAHTVLGALLLHEAREAGLLGDGSLEQKSLNWLIENPEDALRFVEERVPIGAEPYSYAYMMDGLLVRALASSDAGNHRGRLLQEAMLRLNERIRPTGESYGERAFSWSTAHALAGYVAARGHFKQFPRRAPPPSRRIEPRQLLGLAFILVAVGAGLALSFAGAEVAALLPLLTLAVFSGLLILRFIGESTFAGLQGATKSEKDGGSSDGGARRPAEGS